MNILVIGGGGREHALVWKISQSPRVKKIFCAPGNAGIARLATPVPINAEDIEGLFLFAKKEEIDLTVVGPELPLVAGIVDLFEKNNLRIFGPSIKAARLEGSKSFAKSIMKKYGIPTADYRVFEDPQKAAAYVKRKKAPLVVKADGLAAGKGVFVCRTEQEAIDAINEIMVKKAFGKEGDKLVVEDLLTGEEVSFMAITDGLTVLPLPASKDHKTIHDNDKGPNTGGMGAYSPAPVIDSVLQQKIMDNIMTPIVKAMDKEGSPYKGLLYAGLMVQDKKASVLEFNVRFGDPEAQPILARMRTDLVETIDAVIDGRLSELTMQWDKRSALCVVMTAQGYPGAYKKGDLITGLDSASKMQDVMVFHAGTALDGKQVVTNGGRVLGVTALGDGIKDAMTKAYSAVSKIKWQGAYYRRDIGGKGLVHAEVARPPQVGIVMGSASDQGVMENAAAALKEFQIPYEMTVASAHRSPELARSYAKNARSRGLKVIIAGAGSAAHLAGAIAAHTTLPVIGVPIDSSSLKGLDALLSTVQMPAGIPVATMAVGEAGARNAGVLAAQIISLYDENTAARLAEYKITLAKKVAKTASEMKKRG
ncbi:MAG: phosphoribosylamine--glycine ligase [Pseudomonadota bacterium]